MHFKGRCVHETHTTLALCRFRQALPLKGECVAQLGGSFQPTRRRSSRFLPASRVAARLPCFDVLSLTFCAQTAECHRNLDHFENGFCFVCICKLKGGEKKIFLGLATPIGFLSDKRIEVTTNRDVRSNRDSLRASLTLVLS